MAFNVSIQGRRVRAAKIANTIRVFGARPGTNLILGPRAVAIQWRSIRAIVDLLYLHVYLQVASRQCLEATSRIFASIPSTMSVDHGKCFENVHVHRQLRNLVVFVLYST